MKRVRHLIAFCVEVKQVECQLIELYYCESGRCRKWGPSAQDDLPVVALAEPPEMSYFARGMMSGVEYDAADHPGHARPVQGSMRVGFQRERPCNLTALLACKVKQARCRRIPLGERSNEHSAGSGRQIEAVQGVA
jgi:hypothetical protein